MQKKKKQKLILICLLLCALLLGSYATAFQGNSMESYGEKNLGFFFAGVESAPFSVDKGITEKQNDGMTATRVTERISAFFARQVRWWNGKTDFNISTKSSIGYLANFTSPARLSSRIYPQLSLNVIMMYLHKQDGLK